MMPTSMLKVESTSASATEELTEHIVHVHVVTTTSTMALLLRVLVNAFSALRVIDSALLWVTKNLVCISNFRKLHLCCLWIVSVLVRMVPDSKLLERFLQLRLSDALLHTHHVVVVVLRLLRLTLGPATEATSASTKATATEATSTKGISEIVEVEKLFLLLLAPSSFAASFDDA